MTWAAGAWMRRCVAGAAVRGALVLALSVLLWGAPAQAVQRSILNPSFETPAITGTCFAFVSQSLAGGWRSTETVTTGTGACGVPLGTGGVIEYWGNGFNGVTSDNGANHIELNAFNAARVSQSVCLVAGDQVNWRFSHRARDVGLGAGSQDVALFSVDSSANSVRRARTTAAGGISTLAGDCPAASGGVTGNSCAQSTVGTWGRYSGSFTWAGSSGAHDIGFAEISNSTNTAGVGNFLDNIQFTLKPMVEFDSASASSYVVAESAGTVTLKLRVAGVVPAGGVLVPFTVSGTATSGSDYTALATSNFTIPAGDYGTGTVINASPTLTLLDDASVEDTETVVFTLGASTPASPYVLSSTSICGTVATATATVSILDNDVNVSLAKAIVGVPADGGKFNLQITGGTPSGGTNPANNVGHGGTTGAVRVATGATATLAETAGTATLLTNYTTTLACTDGNGAAVTVSGSGTSRTVTTPATGTTTATALTAAARTFSCTYTNTNIAVPALKLVKTSSTPSFAVGVPASYTLTLTNTGVFATQAVTAVTDTVPATLTLGTMPAGCSAAGQVVSCTVPTGLPATTGTVSFVIPVTPLAAAVPSVSNTATANGGGDPACVGTGNCTSTVVTPVLAQPRITVRKTTSNGAGSNTFGFVLSGVTNPADSITLTGASSISSAVVHTGTVGTGATLTESSVPAGWPATPAAVSCLDSATATSGNAATNLATLAGNVATLPAGVMRGGAVITCTFTNTAAPVVALTKSAPATVAPGGTLAYGLSLANTGAIATGTSVVVREQLPPGVVANSVGLGAGVTAVACGTLPSAAGALLNCTMTITGGIPVGGTRSFTLNATAPLAAAGTVLTNHANTNVIGSGTAATAPGAACVSNASVSCANASTTIPHPKVQIVKTTTGGSGSNLFGFALSGLSAPTDTITVVGAGTASGSATLVGSAGLEASIKETVPTGWPANPVSASCLDSASATPTVPFGTLVANQLTIPAAHMVAGANITCTFTNGFGFSVGGRVFNDNGTGAGIANDGLPNGGEAGIAGVAVRLSNCAATVLASAVTDGAGRYTLAVPFATAAAAPLCVEETNPATPTAWTSTGASVGGTVLPSGTATTVAGTAYTYTRAGTPDRIAFTWNGSGHAGLNFGDVAPNTLAADGAKTGLPGSTVSFPHTFQAQTGGSVSFGIPASVATPTLVGWSGKIFADTACTGALQAGAALLYPPSVPVTVVAGQSVCLVMQEFIPANAMNGNSNVSTVQASFVFTNASPGLSASYTVHDITTVSNTALDLKKEVRNVTQGGAFGINNQAKTGETLEYRITYTNNGVSPIGTLSVNDTTPSYTSFVGAQAGTTPATLTACQKHTPANPTPAPTVACATAQAGGGTGALSWHFTGVLSPGASGSVMFTVKVD